MCLFLWQEFERLRAKDGSYKWYWIHATIAEIHGRRHVYAMAIKLEKVGRTAIYGSYFNFYLCHFQGRVRLPGGSSIPVDYNVGGARCDLG